MLMVPVRSNSAINSVVIKKTAEHKENIDADKSAEEDFRVEEHDLRDGDRPEPIQRCDIFHMLSVTPPADSHGDER